MQVLFAYSTFQKSSKGVEVIGVVSIYILWIELSLSQVLPGFNFTTILEFDFVFLEKNAAIATAVQVTLCQAMSRLQFLELSGIANCVTKGSPFFETVVSIGA